MDIPYSATGTVFLVHEVQCPLGIFDGGGPITILATSSLVPDSQKVGHDESKCNLFGLDALSYRCQLTTEAAVAKRTKSTVREEVQKMKKPQHPIHQGGS